MQDEVLAFLGDPATHGGRPVERIDTHGAAVFLAGDRAWKLKRAVRFPYMDFSTVERRHDACLAELRVNRRTAPELYLAVVPVLRRPDGSLALGRAEGGREEGRGSAIPADGVAIDWVVLMRRFDGDGLFDRLAIAGALTPAHMRALAGEIAAFHASAAVYTQTAGPDRRGGVSMAAVVDGNLAELRRFAPVLGAGKVERLAALSAGALEAHAPLLERRRAKGFVRHCHGDLHLRNIVLIDGRPRLFDAIEFDLSLAIVDVFYDLAFLIMDLEHRRARGLANVLLNRMLEITGDMDGLGPLPLFLSARAAVRAKVEAAKVEAGAEAAGYLDLAVTLLEPPPPRLIAIGGLSGTGKTRLAQTLAPGLGAVPGAVVLRSDIIRKHLLGVSEDQRLGEDGYGADITRRVYDEMLACAGRALNAGQAVVLDAVFAHPQERAAVDRLARRAGVGAEGLWLVAPEALRGERVAARLGDASDATVEVVRRQEAYDTGSIAWSYVDASARPEEVLAMARARLA
jgi:aminoglycoside phosphotransferase family enzyme/predicted kinase